jgi:aspartate/methionine/tyrosine aminotransferase
VELAKSLSRLGTETAFEVLAKAKKLEAEGKKIIHLEIGEPDFETPDHIKEAAKKALDDNYTHYGPSPGLMEVREVIAEHQSLVHKKSISPENVIFTPGAKPIMFFTIMSLIEEGDEVIYPNPGFPIYESMINYVGGKPIPMELKEEKGFNADVDLIEESITSRTKLIILNSPNNPCGSVMDSSDIARIADIAKQNDIVILTDEVYKDLYFEGSHESVFDFEGMEDRVIILDGFSKSYAMTGWRLGYGVFPKQFVEPISRLITNSVSCTSSFGQMAAKAAILGPQDSVVRMKEEFKARRDIVVNGLNDINGISCINPKGAFYAFPNIKETGYKSQQLSDALMQEGVALLPGTSFGKYGEGYLRISFANSRENLREALLKIKNFLG